MIGKRLVLLRGDKTQEEVALALGISRARYAHWETGRAKPGSVLLNELAEYYGVTTDYLLGRTENPTEQQEQQEHRDEIPILGRVAAGIPIEAAQDVVGRIEVSPHMASSGEFFALTVRGDSMAPEIREGDVVIVRQQAQVENGTISVVMINGQDATVKKFYASDRGVRLVPINPAYEPLFFSAEEVAMLPVSVLGRVVELRRGY